NLVLKGQGISHPFGLINQQGALENIAGFNQAHGNVQLQGQAGVGVETIFDPARQANAPSQLNIGSSTVPVQAGGELSDAPTVYNIAQRSDGTPNENDYVLDTGGTNGGTITLTWDMYAAPGNSIDVYQGINGQGGTNIFSSNGPVSGSRTVTIKYG